MNYECYSIFETEFHFSIKDFPHFEINPHFRYQKYVMYKVNIMYIGPSVDSTFYRILSSKEEERFFIE
jgi:hypothetical protein